MEVGFNVSTSYATTVWIKVKRMKLLQDQAFCEEPHLLRRSGFFRLFQDPVSLILLQRPKFNKQGRSQKRMNN